MLYTARTIPPYVYFIKLIWEQTNYTDNSTKYSREKQTTVGCVTFGATWINYFYTEARYLLLIRKVLMKSIQSMKLLIILVLMNGCYQLMDNSIWLFLCVHK